MAGWVFGRSWRWWAAGSLSWGLALLAKEWAVLWPVFALVVLLFLHPGETVPVRWKEAFRRFWTTGAVLTGWLIYRASVLGAILSRTRHADFDAWTRWKLAGGFFFRYLRSLAAFYPPALWPTLWPHREATWGGLVLGLLSLLSICGWAWWLCRSGSRLGAACAAMIPVFLAPALMIGEIPWPVVFNPRYLFFVTPFFSVALAETLVRVLPRRRIAAVAALWAVVGLFCQYRDIRPWHDQGTFYQAAVQRSPDSAAAIAELAAIRAQEARHGRPEEMNWTLSGFLRAATLTKSSRRADLRPIRINTEAGAATILLEERRPDAVVTLLSGSPDLDDARLANALAGAEMALHRDDEADTVLTTALRAHPQDYGLHARRAWLLASRSECASARVEETAAREYAGEKMAASYKALSAMIERTCEE